MTQHRYKWGHSWEALYGKEYEMFPRHSHNNLVRCDVVCEKEGEEKKIPRRRMNHHDFPNVNNVGYTK